MYCLILQKKTLYIREYLEYVANTHDSCFYLKRAPLGPLCWFLRSSQLLNIVFVGRTILLDTLLHLHNICSSVCRLTLLLTLVPNYIPCTFCEMWFNYEVTTFRCLWMNHSIIHVEVLNPILWHVYSHPSWSLIFISNDKELNTVKVWTKWVSSTSPTVS